MVRKSRQACASARPAHSGVGVGPQSLGPGAEGIAADPTGLDGTDDDVERGMSGDAGDERYPVAAPVGACARGVTGATPVGAAGTPGGR